MTTQSEDIMQTYRKYVLYLDEPTSEIYTLDVIKTRKNAYQIYLEYIKKYPALNDGLVVTRASFYEYWRDSKEYPGKLMYDRVRDYMMSFNRYFGL